MYHFHLFLAAKDDAKLSTNSQSLWDGFGFFHVVFILAEGSP
jgi:hypothetical protein